MSSKWHNLFSKAGSTFPRHRNGLQEKRFPELLFMQYLNEDDWFEMFHILKYFFYS